MLFSSHSSHSFTCDPYIHIEIFRTGEILIPFPPQIDYLLFEYIFKEYCLFGNASVFKPRTILFSSTFTSLGLLSDASERFFQQNPSKTTRGKGGGRKEQIKEETFLMI